MLNYTDHTVHSVKGTAHWMVIYPDPEFDQFADGFRQIFLPRNDYLTINVGSGVSFLLFV